MIIGKPFTVNAVFQKRKKYGAKQEKEKDQSGLNGNISYRLQDLAGLLNIGKVKKAGNACSRR